MSAETIAIEDARMPPFFAKIPVAIERGVGVRVWDEEGGRYLDLTAGWGVTSIGHAHPAIRAALAEQGGRILQGPNAGLTYSPARAALLSLLTELLPSPLTRVFFTNSGAEANDAAIKLARKVTGRRVVIATEGSFHGRTLSTLSATGQSAHRDKFVPLVPGYRFVRYDDLAGLGGTLDADVAAVIVEPIQGEGGVRIPSAGYLAGRLRAVQGERDAPHRRRGADRLLPHRTDVRGERLRRAAGLPDDGQGHRRGLPDGSLRRLRRGRRRSWSPGDHGGTYCGNPLACAVARAVIRVLLDEDIAGHVAEVGRWALAEMTAWLDAYPRAVTGRPGRGAPAPRRAARRGDAAARVDARCLSRRLFVRRTQGNAIRVFPALTITREELAEGLAILRESIAAAEADEGC